MSGQLITKNLFICIVRKTVRTRNKSKEGHIPHNPALMPCPLQGTFPFIIEHLIYVFCYGPTTGEVPQNNRINTHVKQNQNPILSPSF